MATYFEDKKTRVILKDEDTHMENKLTDKQKALLVKLGATESKIKNLSVKEASKLIREFIAKAEKGDEVTIVEPKKATTKAKTKKETSKKETEKVVETKAVEPKKEAKKQETKTSNADHALVEQLTQAIKDAYNGELKKELSFLQESKIDELAVFIIEYAKKNKIMALNTAILVDLANKFAKENKNLFTFNFDTKVEKETETKVEAPKKPVAKATTKKATSSSTSKTTKETKKLNETLQKDVFVQQSFEALLQKLGK